ncbi:hypothetical protein [Mesobacillus maritimus]|uniref:Uncharacterized protein n=1 Tax=Mesobacillus maritimus TaxID=1643336 RepID=A0ABS7K1N2_9BACI|nr:hypothetical protein [Mesobacillus maritimus]MBY0096152.1 hypothetical protein [Mesobacillus maritimus]
MAEKKIASKQVEKNDKLDRSNNDRHNENARTSAALEPITPRINTDHL